MADKNAPARKDKDAREARLKAALKANLGRRKAQANARKTAVKESGQPKEQNNG